MVGGLKAVQQLRWPVVGRRLAQGSSTTETSSSIQTPTLDIRILIWPQTSQRDPAGKPLQPPRNPPRQQPSPRGGKSSRSLSCNFHRGTSSQLLDSTWAHFLQCRLRQRRGPCTISTRKDDNELGGVRGIGRDTKTSKTSKTSLPKPSDNPAIRKSSVCCDFDRDG